MSNPSKQHTAFFSAWQDQILLECKRADGYLRKAKTDNQRHKAVHETRKAFKRNRAALRLVRDTLPYYRASNLFFRDQARHISAVRDATAHLETLRKLEKRYAPALRPKAFATSRAALIARREQLAHQTFHTEQRLPAIQAALAEQVAEIRRWKGEITEFDQIRSGIRRVYRRGRRAFRRTLQSRRIEDLHEWRKRIKYLRYQLELLQRIWAADLTAATEKLNHLAEQAGTMHDLYQLRKTLLDLDASLLQDPAGEVLHALLNGRQEALEAEVLELGKQFYAPTPNAFCDWLGSYWDVYWESAVLSP